MELQKLTSHPIHILDEEGLLSPTALIPFCSVNDNYFAMGVKIDQLSVPVCNIFRPKLLRDQLCYSVDLNSIKAKFDSKEKVYFSFFVDYNEDREVATMEHEKMNRGIKHEITIETIGSKKFNSSLTT